VVGCAGRRADRSLRLRRDTFREEADRLERRLWGEASTQRNQYEEADFVAGRGNATDTGAGERTRPGARTEAGTERRRSRTYPAWGYQTSPVLKTGCGTGRRRSGARLAARKGALPTTRPPVGKADSRPRESKAAVGDDATTRTRPRTRGRGSARDRRRFGRSGARRRRSNRRPGSCRSARRCCDGCRAPGRPRR
jgi:hypothetical protein